MINISNSSRTHSTKLSVRSVVICKKLTEDIVAFSGEWDNFKAKKKLNCENASHKDT